MMIRHPMTLRHLVSYFASDISHLCVAVCCSALQCVAVYYSVSCFKSDIPYSRPRLLHPIRFVVVGGGCQTKVYCSALQCVAVCCSVLQYVAVRCSALQCTPAYPVSHQLFHIRGPDCFIRCVAVCCSVLQRVAVRCRVLQCTTVYYISHQLFHTHPKLLRLIRVNGVRGRGGGSEQSERPVQFPCS